MKHFQDGNMKEVEYDYNMFASKYKEDYSNYGKSMLSHSSDEEFYNYDGESTIKHFQD